MPKTRRRRRHNKSTSSLQDLSSPMTQDLSPPMAQDPQPDQTLTLTPPSSPPPHQEPDQQPDQVPQDPAPSPSPLAPTIPDAPAIPDVPDPPPTSRKPPGKRKKPIAGKKLAAIQEKLEFLCLNLRPVAFTPGRALDLPRHERLLRALGLWDFAHLNLGNDPPRIDLLTPLIAYYDSTNRYSEVRGVRIIVNRPALARSLAIPIPAKREKVTPSEEDLVLFSGEEAAAVMSDFISDWIVVMEDASVLPEEVVAATKLVKEGQPHKVDWAGLVWTMVEKDLQEAATSGQCYYASHLQQLIKHQRPKIFEADTEMEPEPSAEVVLAEDEDETGNEVSAVRTISLEDFQDMDADNHGPGLSLALGPEVDAMLGLEDCKVGVEQHWLTGGKDAGASHCMQPCSSNDITAMECDEMGKVALDMGMDMDGSMEAQYDQELSVKFSGLERLSSTDLLQAIEGANICYNMQSHPPDPSSGDFLAMGTETHKNMEEDIGPSSPFSFRNSCKRDIDGIGDDDDDNDDNDGAMHPCIQGNQQKRMRSDGPWGHTTSTFDTCMEQMQCWMDKAKMVHVEKEQACANAQVELQYASNMLQQKDQIIHSLEKTRLEEAQKRELEASRFVHDLRLMTRLVYGYKKALKETRDAFAEYRKKFPSPQVDEPLYKDVGGAGGLVLSTREVERQRLEKEKELHHVAAELITEFGRVWFEKFTAYHEMINDWESKFMKYTEDFKLLKETYEKAKVSET